jgi:thioredoxin reductase
MLVDAGNQRNTYSHGMHNYPTRDGALPVDFLAVSRDELSRYNVVQTQGVITEARKEDEFHFRLTDSEGATHDCRRILIATGVTDHIPAIPGMKELWGSDVHHCPYCDGWECRDTTVGLYASRMNGYGMALALGALARDIVIFTDGKHYLRGVQAAQLLKRGVRVVTERVRELVREDDKLLGVCLENGSLIPCDKMFVNHGFHINGELLSQLGCRCSRKGAAITNRKQQTSIPGVYAAGDATIDIHFVVVAAAEGAKAAVAIHNDLLQVDNAPALKYKDENAEIKKPATEAAGVENT